MEQTGVLEEMTKLHFEEIEETLEETIPSKKAQKKQQAKEEKERRKKESQLLSEKVNKEQEQTVRVYVNQIVLKKN